MPCSEQVSDLTQASTRLYGRVVNGYYMVIETGTMHHSLPNHEVSNLEEVFIRSLILKSGIEFLFILTSLLSKDFLC